MVFIIHRIYLLFVICIYLLFGIWNLAILKRMHRAIFRSYRLLQCHIHSVTSLVSYSCSSGDSHFGSKVLPLKNNTALQKKKKIMLIEGFRNIETCVKTGFNPKTLYFTRDCANGSNTILQLLSDKVRESVLVKQVSTKKMADYSKLETPPGIIGLFPMPENDSFLSLPREPTYPIFVILDNIRSPDNMGAIIRTAAAAGCQAVLCTSGCVCLWNDKVIRASMLSNLYIKVDMSLTWAEIRKLLPNNCGVVVAHSNVNSRGTTLLYDEINYAEEYKNGVAVILCNESSGPSNEAFDFCNKTNSRFIHIPMSKPIDSLNVAVASGVILFRIARDFS